MALWFVVFVGDKCALVWDETTRNQRKFMAVHVQHFMVYDRKTHDAIYSVTPNTDVKSFCFGYVEEYSGSGAAGFHAIKSSVTAVNEFIDFWNDHEEVIREAFPNQELHFDHVEERVRVNQSDRATVN